MKQELETGSYLTIMQSRKKSLSHDFDLDDVKITDRCSQWSRLFLEAWPSIRAHIYILDIYKAFDLSEALLKHSFAFVSHFIAECSSILTETSPKVFQSVTTKFLYFLLLYFTHFMTSCRCVSNIVGSMVQVSSNLAWVTKIFSPILWKFQSHSVGIQEIVSHLWMVFIAYFAFFKILKKIGVKENWCLIRSSLKG